MAMETGWNRDDVPNWSSVLVGPLMRGAEVQAG
jgi:hypothetical protein